MSGPDELLERAWEEHRGVLLDVAYRLLGSRVDAEDAVQEAFARLARQPLETIEDHRAWLVVVVSRICLDQLGSARAKREAYVGPWLPEPLVAVAGTELDPAQRITLDESVRMALLVVLERLTPAERVAFVLHDIFALTFDQIGEIVGRTPEACRQLASRARRRIHSDAAARFDIDADRERDVARRFLAASETGDIAALIAVLDPDVVLRADSNGKVHAPRREVTGRDRIAKIIASGATRFPGATKVPATVNGAPGLIVRDGGRLVAVIALTVHAGLVRGIDVIANPDKLARMPDLLRPSPNTLSPKD